MIQTRHASSTRARGAFRPRGRGYGPAVHAARPFSPVARKGAGCLMTTFAYMRVSTRAQAEQNSCAMQRSAIELWAKGQGLVIDHWHEDAGFSGTRMDRPAWDELNQVVKGGDCVVSYDLSRTARNLIGLLTWVQAMKAKRVRVVFVKESLDLSTPMGDLLLGVLGAFAQWTAELNREKAREGMARGKANGAKYGRKPKLSPEQTAELVAMSGTGRDWVRRAAARFGLHVNGVRYIYKAATARTIAQDKPVALVETGPAETA